MQQQIQSDLKAALLGGDKEKVETLKGLKSAFLYEAVAQKIDRENIKDDLITMVLARESKKRQEAIDVYSSAGETERAEKEAREKKTIDHYLPEQMSEEQVGVVVAEEIAKVDSPSIRDMGRIIGAVKSKTGASADGSLVAKLVKQAIEASS